MRLGCITDQTTTSGELCLRYVADEPGGKIKIEASPTDAPPLNSDNFATVDVRVPNLVLLPKGSDSLHYKNIGGTLEHPGPPANPTLDMNHWGTVAVDNAFPFIAFNYFVMFHPQYPIYVNDMSLPKGGLFDINGNWFPPHQGHRQGTGMDLMTKNIDHPEGIPIKYQFKLQDDIIRKYFPNAEVDIHDPGTKNEHFHVYYH